MARLHGKQKERRDPMLLRRVRVTGAESKALRRLPAKHQRRGALERPPPPLNPLKSGALPLTSFCLPSIPTRRDLHVLCAATGLLQTRLLVTACPKDSRQYGLAAAQQPQLPFEEEHAA